MIQFLPSREACRSSSRSALNPSRKSRLLSRPWADRRPARDSVSARAPAFPEADFATLAPAIPAARFPRRDSSRTPGRHHLHPTTTRSAGVPVTGYLKPFISTGNNHVGGAMITGWPVALTGLEQRVRGGPRTSSPRGWSPGGVRPAPRVRRRSPTPTWFLPYRIDLHGHPSPLPCRVLDHPTGSREIATRRRAPWSSSRPQPAWAMSSAWPRPRFSRPGRRPPASCSASPRPGGPASGSTTGWGPGTRPPGGPCLSTTSISRDWASSPPRRVADVTGDGHPDVIQAADSGAIQALDGLTGAVASGFPKWVADSASSPRRSATLLRTGTVSVAAMTREGYLHVWQTAGLTSANNEGLALAPERLERRPLPSRHAAAGCDS